MSIFLGYRFRRIMPVRIDSQESPVTALELCARSGTSSRPIPKISRPVFSLRETRIYQLAQIIGGECHRLCLRMSAILRSPRLSRGGGLPVESPDGSCPCFLDHTSLLACNAYIREQQARNHLGPFELQILALAYLSGVQWRAHKDNRSHNEVHHSFGPPMQQSTPQTSSGQQ